MKISRRLMLRLSGLGATTMALMGCAGQGEGFLAWLEGLFPSASVPGTPAQPGAPVAPAPVQPALPPYNADPLTGEARRTDGRIVGVMVNNICNSRRQNARPQRGIGAADLLIESRVEGGITRLCAVYHDVDAIPEVGPVRSGRDQFLQLLMPWQALYCHDGESEACTKFVSVYDYAGLNLGGKGYFGTPVHPLTAHRDPRGGEVAYEHTEFTSGKEIRSSAKQAGMGLSYPYEETFFRFADYRTGAENTLEGMPEAQQVEIAHAAKERYKTQFHYDPQTRQYKMSMYSPAASAWQHTVDELTGQQLGFDNLAVCFAPIAPYPGDAGDVQQVQYIQGGEALLFTRGRVQTGYWQKASPQHPLYLCAEDGTQLCFNRGKSYLAIVDEDERAGFAWQ